MLKARLVVVTVALAACAPLAPQMPRPAITPVGAAVWVISGPTEHANAANQGFMINATVIRGRTSAILVDSGGTVDVGRMLRATAERTAGAPVRTVINTHPHGDHYLGNGAFAGAEIVSSEKGRRLVETGGGEWIALMARDTGRELKGTVVIEAATTYPAGRHEAMVDGVRLLYWVPRGSHTDGDLMVYLPDDRVMITGDVLVNDIVPTLQDGHLRNWIATLDEILASDATTFVPGHGPVMSRADVVEFRKRMVAFRDGIRDAFRRGLNEREARNALDLSAWEAMGRSYMIPRNINRAYLEAEEESFDR